MKTVLAILSLCCAGLTTAHSQTTNKAIVKQSRRNKETITVDVGPAVKMPDGSEVAGLHGEILTCNIDQPSCYMPFATDFGYIDANAAEAPYQGINVTIQWHGRIRSTYVVTQSY